MPGVDDGVGVGAGGAVAVGVFIGAGVIVGAGDGAGVALGVGVAVIVINMGVRLFGVDVTVSVPVVWASWACTPPPDAHATSARAVNSTVKIVKSFVFIVLPLF